MRKAVTRMMIVCTKRNKPKQRNAGKESKQNVSLKLPDHQNEVYCLFAQLGLVFIVDDYICKIWDP